MSERKETLDKKLTDFDWGPWLEERGLEEALLSWDYEADEPVLTFKKDGRVSKGKCDPQFRVRLKAKLNVPQYYDLAEKYLKGDGVEKDMEKAFLCYRASADRDHDERGQCEIGLLYYQGIIFKQDHRKAFEYFKRAADQGSSQGYAFLGSLYVTGAGVEKDYEKAFECFHQGALKGDTSCQSSLLRMFNEGMIKNAQNINLLVQHANRMILNGDNEAFDVLLNLLEKHYQDLDGESNRIIVEDLKLIDMSSKNFKKANFKISHDDIVLAIKKAKSEIEQIRKELYELQPEKSGLSNIIPKGCLNIIFMYGIQNEINREAVKQRLKRK